MFTRSIKVTIYFVLPILAFGYGKPTVYGDPLFQTKTKSKATKGANKPAPTYMIYSEPVDSEVVLDDKSLGNTDDKGQFALKNPAKGRHHLIVKHNGYKDYDEFVIIEAGGELRVQLDREVMTLIVKSAPKLEVLVDDTSRGMTDKSGSLAVDHLLAGPHSIRVQGRGYSPTIRSYVLTADQAVLEITPEPDPLFVIVNQFEDLLQKGVFLGNGQENAFAKYDKLLKETPDHSQLPVMRAELLDKIAERGEAIVQKLSYSKATQAELVETRDIFQAADKLKPEDRFAARTHFFIAASLPFGLEKRDKRELDRMAASYKEELRRAVNIDPSFPAPHNYLALADFTLDGDYGTAAHELKAATDLAPQWPAPHFTLARIYVEQNRFDEAIIEFQKAVKLDDKMTTAKLGLAMAQSLRGASEIDSKIIADEIASSDDTPFVHYALGRIYLQQREYAKAATELDRAINQNGLGVEFNNNQARSLLKDAQKKAKH